VCLLIDSEDQKNRQTQVYPVVDDFADFLLKTPKEQRVGFVFNVFQSSVVICRRPDTVSGLITDIGQAAKVDEKDGKEKFASAHDLRRAFGTRWARIVPSGILQQLMRHASIETTMSFYVNITAKLILLVFCNTPDRSRTCGLRFRKAPLYPAELRGHLRNYTQFSARTPLKFV